MRRVAPWLAASLLLLGAACSDDGGGDEGTATTTSTTTSAPPDATDGTGTTSAPVGDGSVFCDAMIAVGQVGTEGDEPAEVLAANQELATHLDEAMASMPEDSPADLALLLDDYRAAVGAINAAAGDREAAYDALPEDVATRLASPTSHQEGYRFLVDRCGITAPG